MLPLSGSTDEKDNMTAPTALVVDDEPDIRELLEITLTRMHIRCVTAANLTEAKGLLAGRSFELCLTDMNLPDGNGIELVQWMQKNHPEIPVAVITAYGSMETAISALKAGAFDFVSKPVELPRLRELVGSALRLADAASETEAQAESSDGLMLGDSAEINHLRRQIRKVSRSQAPVYISGESGSGKELVARMIHLQGPRREKPFVPVNCGAIPSELMESEFFGHRKGSFTGATEHKEGLFKAANGGTLFLDEVADLPVSMQVKLLRAIQEKAVRAVGDHQEQSIDVRILSATHKDLPTLVKAGTFRQDLFYRINVIELKVPPLRARREDIPLLAHHILERLARDYESDVATLSDAALAKLCEYPFPGNVRELENILERAFTLCDDDLIDASDLQLTSAGDAEAGPASAPDGEIDLEHFLERIERDAIEKALEATAGNKTAAAKRLGISFRAMRYRLKKLGME